MGDIRSAKFDEYQVEALDELQDDIRSQEKSEALRKATVVGLQELGYMNGNSNTRLKAATYRLSWLFMVAGVVGLAFTFAYPVPARVPSFAVVMTGTALYAASEWLDGVEPAVTNKLRSLVGGETA